MRYQDATQTIITACEVGKLVKHANVFEPAPHASKKTKRLIAKLRRTRQVQQYGETVKFTKVDAKAITLDLLDVPGVVKAIAGVFRFTQRPPQAVLVGDDVFCKLIADPAARQHISPMNDSKGRATTISLDRIDLVVDGHRVNFCGISMVVIPWMQGWVVL